MLPTATKKPPSMRALTARLKEINLSFNDILRFVQTFRETNTATEVEVRLGKLDQLWESYSEVLVEIFAHDDYKPESATLEKERTEFSDRYYEAKSFLMDKAKDFQGAQELEQSMRTSDASVHGSVDHVRLPQIKLQTFNGDIDEWLSFRDLYTSLIHWKVDLPDVEKFHYLKGCLQGEPRNLIDSLPITKANYQVAWESLLRRYNNSKHLKKRQVLDCLPSRSVNTRGVRQTQSQQKQKSSSVKASYGSTQTSGGRCVVCSTNHPLYQCNAFQRLEVSDRDALLKTHSLCRNCFKAGHLARECQSKYSCRHCKGRHHSLVCFNPKGDGDKRVWAAAGCNKPIPPEDPSKSRSIQVASMTATNALVSGTVHQHASQVLLATAVVIIEDDNGCRHHARALLDSGSESNFITERLSQLMKVTRDRVDISVLGIGQATIKVKQTVHALVRSRVSQFSRELDFLVLPKVTVNLPTIRVDTNGWSLPSGIKLADPAFFEPNAVDLVLGIEHFFDFFETDRRMSLGEGNPALHESVFGWIVSGGVSVPSRSLQITCNVSTLDELDALISRFWSCEEVESGKAHSPEETRVKTSLSAQYNEVRTVGTPSHYR
ncbi:uncharacterized protein LOC135714549 [Ochlerotatus camptorhynchus]|uniref:uncharacterized protein LOC135714549 n=1 Tax=Ochlerotatus camptorhynchus TaxID=644619 RepID=UPI0031E33BB2